MNVIRPTTNASFDDPNSLNGHHRSLFFTHRILSSMFRYVQDTGKVQTWDRFSPKNSKLTKLMLGIGSLCSTASPFPPCPPCFLLGIRSPSQRRHCRSRATNVPRLPSRKDPGCPASGVRGAPSPDSLTAATPAD